MTREPDRATEARDGQLTTHGDRGGGSGRAGAGTGSTDPGGAAVGVGDRGGPPLPTLPGGRYHSEAVIATGGMGLVLRARDELLGRTVAIKLLADNLAHDEIAVERFRREASAMARLNHPNIVQVFDVGALADGRPFLVMECVDGGSLADELRRGGNLAPSNVERVARDALAGLAHAHAAGLLHRDLKPGNLLRAATGDVKVTDFGIAEAAEAPGLTRTGIVLGTLAYLAPERARGQRADERSDLYGLAAALVELLTGSPPDHRGERPVVLPDETPPGLRALITTCLARDPDERPRSADEALRVLAGDLDTVALPPPETVALPVGDDATTIAIPDAPEAAGAPTAVLEPDEPGGVAAPRRDDRQDADRLTRRIAAGVVVVAILLAIAASIGSNGEPTTARDGTSAEQTTPAAGGQEPAAEVPPVPRGSSPEETARNLAEWLRDLAG